MDKKKLREIIAVFKESGLAKMEISESNEEGNYSVKLENAVAAAPAPVQFVSLPEPKQDESQASSAEIKDFNKYRDVKWSAFSIPRPRRTPSPLSRSVKR